MRQLLHVHVPLFHCMYIHVHYPYGHEESGLQTYLQLCYVCTCFLEWKFSHIRLMYIRDVVHVILEGTFYMQVCNVCIHVHVHVHDMYIAVHSFQHNTTLTLHS